MSTDLSHPHQPDELPKNKEFKVKDTLTNVNLYEGGETDSTVGKNND